MIEYYKCGEFIRKVEDNKVYWYSTVTKAWRIHTAISKRLLLSWGVIPLTLLDLDMLGVVE